MPDHEHTPPETPRLKPCSELMTCVARLCMLVEARAELLERKDVMKVLLGILSFMMSEGFL